MIYGQAVAIDGGEIDLEQVIDGGEISLSTLIDGGEVGVFFDTGRGGLPYTGAYDVVPTFEDQEFQTAGRQLRENMIFRAIPVLEVSNIQGGITVTIGG